MYETDHGRFQGLLHQNEHSVHDTLDELRWLAQRFQVRDIVGFDTLERIFGRLQSRTSSFQISLGFKLLSFNDSRLAFELQTTEREHDDTLATQTD